VGRKNKNLTLGDVAKHAGYSASTASFVFQNNPVVAASTREKILASAKELGYVYNRRAASIRRERSDSVGVIVGGFSNPFFGQLTEAVERALSPEYTLIIGNSLDDTERQGRLISRFLESRVDGLIIVPSLSSTANDLESPIDLGVPTILMTRYLPGVAAPYFGIQDRKAGRDAATHLLAHGVESIAYFGGPADLFIRVARKEGVSDVALGAGIEFDELWSASTRVSSTDAYSTAKELLKTNNYPQAVVCHTDSIAIGLMRALHEHGVVVGQDIRLIGFDDIEAPFTVPALTSVSVDAREMGRLAADSLLKMMQNPSDEIGPSLFLEPKLVLRESCGPH
jgi:LacI family transcriptional regulator